MPVVTYALAVALGYAVRPLELAGGSLTIAAFVYNNTAARGAADAPTPST